MARNIENGGSPTIIATCLIDTGLRLDQLIFEESKGTGNSEVILDRSLAEAHLYTEDQTCGLATLRKVLSSYHQRQAIEAMFKLLEKYPDNNQFLQNMAAGG